jgi:hypothetical protein
MTVHIPVWLLWTLGLGVGIPLLVAILVFAYVGFVFVRDVSRHGGFF